MRELQVNQITKVLSVYPDFRHVEMTAPGEPTSDDLGRLTISPRRRQEREGKKK